MAPAQWPAVRSRAPNSTGTNIGGGTLTVTAGNGTGTGGSGSILFQTAPAGSSGATADVLATRMAITNAGNVGIGTAAPATIVDVLSGNNWSLTTSNGDIRLGATPSTTPYYLKIGIATGGSGAGDAYIASTGGGTSRLFLGTVTSSQTSGYGYSQTMTIAGGNVGIGTGATNPASQLYVGSGTVAGGTMAGLDVAIGTANYIAASDGTKTVFIGADNNAYGIVGTLTNHDLVVRTNNTEHMRVLAGGNVGIGTSTPNAKLTISGIGGSNGASGGASPTDGLEFFSTGNSNGYSGWAGRIYADVPSGGWGTDALNFSVPNTSGSEIKTMTLLNGNVGVDNTSPGSITTWSASPMVDVAGNVYANNLWMKVSEQTLASNSGTASVTFSGLAGTTDKMYMITLEGEISCGDNSADISCLLQFNGDATSGDYRSFGNMYGDDASSNTTTNGIFLFRSSWTSTSSWADFVSTAYINSYNGPSYSAYTMTTGSSSVRNYNTGGTANAMVGFNDAGTWISTANISSIKVLLTAKSFYGLKATLWALR